MSNMTRRAVLRNAPPLIASAVLTASGIASSAVSAQTTFGSPQQSVKALFFDVFGTLVDWRTGVAREAELILGPRGYSLDWLTVADAWRAEYGPGMEEVRSSRIPFAKLDVLHRRMLDRLLPRFGVKDLPEDVVQNLNFAWHRLDGWPDVTPGISRLGQRFLLAPVSNGNILLMADLARRNHWRWDAILGAELAGDYKPKPRVYLAAAEAFGLSPSECMMVSAAAHTSDILGAAGAGLRTASVARPDEFGPGKAESTPKVPVDLAAKNLDDLAVKLGA
jgi:2-haloacid dehalogenase